MLTSCFNIRDYIEPIRPCLDKPEVSIQRQGVALDIVLKTKNLWIVSIKNTPEMIETCVRLFGDRVVMQKYATGETRPRDAVITRCMGWIQRFASGDPFSAYAVLSKNRMIGLIVPGHGDLPGVSEIAGLGEPSMWDQGYAKEAATAVIHHLLPEIRRQGILLEGRPLERVVATARPDNMPTVRILEDVGMDHKRSEVKYGSIRKFYEIESSDFGMDRLQRKAEEKKPHWIIRMFLTPLSLLQRFFNSLHRLVLGILPRWGQAR